MRLLLFLSVIFVCVSINYASKILAVFPAPSRSHVILGTALLKGLAAKGHQVTMVSPFPLSKPVKNYRDIVMGDLKPVLKGHLGDPFEVKKQNPLVMIKSFHDIGIKLTETALSDANFQKLLKSNEKFDVVIVQVLMNEAFLALGDYYGVPLIAFSTVGPAIFSLDLTGNPAPPSYVPEMILGYSDHMTFMERMINTLSGTFMVMYRNFIYIPQQNVIKEKYFPGVPHLNDIISNASIVLHNSHVSLGYPRPMVPAAVEIGGFHVDPPKKLPEDLQKFLDEATEGVIFFSMGSNLRSAQLPVEKRQAFIDAFAQMKEQILWKWEEETIPGKPKNVKIGKWLPQQDILAHPNVKGFMTHGGLLSTIEAITRGVPMVGIPVLGDQKMNMIHAQKLGYAILLDLSNITTNSVTWALREMLDNPKYRNTVKKRSQILKDQEVPPLEKAVFWVEYAIRHGGAPHLRVASKDLNLIQYLLLDVIAFILFILTATFGIIYWSCKKLFCSRKPHFKETSKQKKEKKQ